MSTTPAWAGRTVVITGASAGVGRATAREFGRAGASVGLLARGRERLDETAGEVEALGGRALVLPADVADADAVEAAAAATEAAFGPIDVWVNNAMVSVLSPVHLTTLDEYRRVTDVTYLGAVNGTLAALRRMRARDGGVIVQVGSALAYQSIPLQSAYCASKHALRGFTDSLRMELGHERSGVRVTMVQLPALNTPQFGWVRSRLARRPQPVPPIFEPEVAARAIVWAAERAPRELPVGASTELVILGKRLAPELLERYLAATAWEGQMTDQTAAPRPDNLWAPVPGRQEAAHGAFDDRAQSTSPQLWLVTHPRVARLGLVAAALLAGGLAARLAEGREEKS
jgi:NAD(P)-dependent dehydrogenase (short-subunit alcohol dehydrogenase family)